MNTILMMSGEQINKLLNTINFYLKNNCNFDGEIPESLYPGDYLKNCKVFLDNNSKTNNLKKEVIEKILSDIKKDLKNLKVNHKNFVSEKKVILHSKCQ